MTSMTLLQITKQLLALAIMHWMMEGHFSFVIRPVRVQLPVHEQRNLSHMATLLERVALAIPASSISTLSLDDAFLTTITGTPVSQSQSATLSTSADSKYFPTTDPMDSFAQSQAWQRLYEMIDNVDHNAKGGTEALLQLRHNDGERPRGVYISRDVQNGDVVLSVPLEFCLRDDQPPEWMTDTSDDESSNSVQTANKWATRLAASLIDRKVKQQVQRNSDSSDTLSLDELWFSLFPEASLMKASLPVHWSEDTLQKAASTALELAVDTTYFGRAEAVEDLMTALNGHVAVQTERITLDDRRRLCENALDLIQTRSCRLDCSSDGSDEDDGRGQHVRVLAPVFDFINHSHRSNCQFTLRNGCLTVTALRNLAAEEEVLIDYGSSARPAWKCLASYGFVPTVEGASDENDLDENHVAEIYVEGIRYEVSPTTIPESLVAAVAMAAAPDAMDMTNDPVCLTPDIAMRLARRISDVAFHMILENSWSNDQVADDKKELSEFPETRLSNQLASSLCLNQHRILLACSAGLQEWAIQQTR